MGVMVAEMAESQSTESMLLIVTAGVTVPRQLFVEALPLKHGEAGGSSGFFPGSMTPVHSRGCCCRVGVCPGDDKCVDFGVNVSAPGKLGQLSGKAWLGTPRLEFEPSWACWLQREWDNAPSGETQ